MPLRAVTFDFWDTLMTERAGSLREQRMIAWAETFDLDVAELEAAHDAAHEAYEQAWHDNRQFRVEEAADLILERLDRPLDRDRLIDGFNEGGRRADVRPVEGVRGCLSTLKAAGLRIGIVCDIGLTPSPIVLELLEREDLLDCFDATTFSDRVGYYKPDPRVFAVALDQLGGIAPSEAVHIGDRRRTDVAGALRAGMRAARFLGPRGHDTDDAPEADLVVRRLEEFPAQLGIG